MDNCDAKMTEEPLEIMVDSEELLVSDEQTLASNSPDPKLKIKTRYIMYVKVETERAIRSAMGSSGCMLCTYDRKERDLLASHVREHFTRHYCECGYSASSKKKIGNHLHAVRRGELSGHAGDGERSFEVDKPSYPCFLEEVGLDSCTEYGPLLSQGAPLSSQPRPNLMIDVALRSKRGPYQRKIVKGSGGLDRGNSSGSGSRQVVPNNKSDGIRAKLTDTRELTRGISVASGSRQLPRGERIRAVDDLVLANRLELELVKKKRDELKRTVDGLQTENDRIKRRYKATKRTIQKIKFHWSNMTACFDSDSD